MLKRKKTPFFVALNELDSDLKNLTSFNIKEQSLEILPFSLNRNDSLKIFYIEKRIVILHKGKCVYLNNPDINLTVYDDYNDNYERLRLKYKKKIHTEKNKEQNTTFNHGLGIIANKGRFKDRLKDLINYESYKFDSKEQAVFDELLEKELVSRNTSSSIRFNDNSQNFNFSIFSHNIKNKSDLTCFYSLVNNSRLSYHNENFITDNYDEINVESFISYHNDISLKIKNIIREFVSYRITKSMPKKYFNL